VERERLVKLIRNVEREGLVKLIRGIDDLAHLWGEGEERNDLLPVASPGLRDGRVLAAPGAGLEVFQALLGEFRTVGLVDGPEHGGNRPALFP